MTITPVGPSSSATVPQPAQISARSEQGDVSVRFVPHDAGGPLDRVGSSVMTTLKNFEASRTAKSNAMSSIAQGPAGSVDAAKAELLSGPASASGARITAPAGGTGEHRVENALTAMTRSFDYAIETQLIVKTGSQLSTSASSLMRGQ